MNLDHLQLRRGYNDLQDPAEYDELTLIELLKTFETFLRNEKEKGGDSEAAQMLSMDVRILRAELNRRTGNGKGASIEAGLNLTDLGNAERFAQMHDNARYVYQWGGWIVFQAGAWRKDSGKKIFEMAERVLRAIYKEASECDDSDRRQALAQHGRRSETKERLGAMIFLAQHKLAIEAEQLDADSWVLNCLNGTLDLKTGELRPHRREDFLTKIAPTNYNPEAQAPIFDAFLKRIFGGSPELISFVQRLFGYAITGSVKEQILPFFFGPGGNGKTTLIEAVKDTLGADYADIAAPGLLMAKHGESHPTELADLRGRRLIFSVEVEQGRRMAEVLVKWVTGGDTLKARYMRQDFFSFAPTHKIFLVANHKPVVWETTEGLWRRLRLVPFSVVIPAEERDLELPEKLKGEREGILKWLVEGCLLWQREGLAAPEEVARATQDYRSEQDVLGMFIAEKCEVDPDVEVAAKELYEAYAEWCKGSGEKQMSKRTFGQLLSERGFEADRKNRGRLWKGLKVAP